MNKDEKISILAEIAKKHFPNAEIKKSSLIKRVRVIDKELVLSVYPNGIISLYSEEHYNRAVNLAEEYKEVFKKDAYIDTHYGF